MNAPLMALVALLAADETEATTKAGYVRISVPAYQQLRTRAEAAERAPQPGDDEFEGEEGGEPMAGTVMPRVLEARVTGTLTRKALDLEVNASVEGVAGRWNVLPLVPRAAEVTGVEITGGGSLVLMDDMRSLVFHGGGRHAVKVRIASTGGESGSAREVVLPVVPGTSRVVAIELGGRVDAEITPDALLGVERGGGKRTVRGFLAASEPTLGVRWNAEAEAAPEEPDAPVQPVPAVRSGEPARINVQQSVLASVGERLLTVYATLRYAIFHAPVSRFEWSVPAGAEVLGVQGRGVSEWTCPPGKGERVCFVELPFPVQRTYELSIQLEQPLPRDVKDCAVPLPEARGVQRQGGHVAVEVMGNAEVKPAEGTTAVREDVRELPGDLFTGQSTPILLAFKYLEAPTRVVLDLQRRESVEMSPISVDEASFTTVWTTEGRTITEGTFHVRNRQRQFLALRLPADAVIQSAFVADAPVKPSTGDDGRLRIPLRNQGRSTSDERFVVQVVYIRDNLPLSAVGTLNAELPTLDAEIGAVHHAIVLPDRQRLWAFGGDLSTENPGVVHETRQHHRESGFLDRAMGGGMALNAPAAMPMAEPMPMEQAAMPMQEEAKSVMRDRLSNIAARRARPAAGFHAQALMGGGEFDDGDGVTTPVPVGNTGVLPVRIQIPQNGDRYTAHAFYVPPDRALSWHARTASRATASTVYALAALLGILLGFIAIRERRRLLQRPGFTREQAVALGCAVGLALLGFWFRRQVQMAPGFAVLGVLVGWTWQQVRARTAVSDTTHDEIPAP